MKRSEETGHALANFLHGHSAVEEVMHAGAAWHPQRELFESQMSGSVSLMTFIPRCQDGRKVKQFAKELELFQIGVSWGGYESLVVANEGKPMDWDEKKWFVRIYGGLENVDDLIRDLDKSIEKNLV
jgi:cystathionine beta-lyase/cystathionine gamma-synthase